MKNNKKILIGVFICAAVLLIVIINLCIQINIVESYPLDETAGRAVKNLLFRGGLLHCILVAGIALYFLMTIQQLTRKQTRLLEIMNKLMEKDFSPEEDAADDPALREFRKNIISFGAWINQLKKDDESSAENEKESSLSRTRELNNEKEHTRAVLDNVIQNISGLEERVSVISEELKLTNSTIASYHERINEQIDITKDADNAVSESVSLIIDLSKKTRESSTLSKELESEIAGGEDQVLEVSEMIKDISADLEKIHEITRTINQISEQTNILSMNAAIESAHAGAAGAGFAVVADEIRKLAESTKENAGQISREVNALMEKISEALEAGSNSSASFKEISGKIRGFSEEIVAIDAIASQSLEKTEKIQESVKKTAEISRAAGKKTTEMTADHQDVHRKMLDIKDILDQTKRTILQTQNGSGKTFEYGANLAHQSGKIVEHTNSSASENSFKPRQAVTSDAEKTKKDTAPVKNFSSSSDSFISGSLSAEVREISPGKTETPKKEIFTLKTFPESEKHEIEKTRKTIETVELPPVLESRTVSKLSASESKAGDAEDDYDERGVAVKKPPITIF